MHQCLGLITTISFPKWLSQNVSSVRDLQTGASMSASYSLNGVIKHLIISEVPPLLRSITPATAVPVERDELPGVEMYAVLLQQLPFTRRPDV